jgi:hypothetical protein
VPTLRIPIYNSGLFTVLVDQLLLSDRHAAATMAHLVIEQSIRDPVCATLLSLVGLFESTNVATKLRAVAALACCAKESALRVPLYEAGALPPLVQLLLCDDASILEKTVLAIAELSNEPALLDPLNAANVLSNAAHLLLCSNSTVQLAAMSIFYNFSKTSAFVDGIRGAGAIPYLIVALQNIHNADIIFVVKTVAQLAGEDSSQRLALYNAGAVFHLTNVLLLCSSTNTDASQEAALALTRLAAEPSIAIAMLRTGTILQLIPISDSSNGIARKCALTILAVLVQDPHVRKCLTNQNTGGVLPRLLALTI